MPSPKPIKKSLTPEEKAHKESLRLLTSLFNTTRTFFSLKKITTMGEMYEILGHTKGELEYIYSPTQLSEPLTHDKINQAETAYKMAKEQAFLNKDYKREEPIENEYEGISFSKPTVVDIPKESSTTTYDIEAGETAPLIITPEEDAFVFRSPKQKAHLFTFQNRYAKQLLDGIVVHKKRAQMLRAGVGTGKTFMIGAVIRALYDADFFRKNNCLSPWPVLWVTRSSIVEQTKRVCAQQFGLDTDTECHVLNVEQLRAGFGLDYMVNQITYIEHGEEHTKWKWKPRFHPLVFIIDESQLAKNPDSTQSKIIYALSEIPADEPVYIICVSATPWTRVSEAGYFAANTWMKI